VEPIFPSSGSFPWISNVWRWLLMSHSIDSRVVVEFERHPHPTMLAIYCLFRWFSTFFVSHVKIATFEFFKSLKALWFIKSMLIVSFDKHSMRFCSSFLQMVTKNQCCPQIVVSRHKIRHVQHYYKLYCCMKLVLLSWKSLSDVRTKKWRQWRRLATTLTTMAIYW